MKSLARSTLFLLLMLCCYALAAPAQTTAAAPVWTTICSEADICHITSMPVGTVNRFGADRAVSVTNCGTLGWLAPMTSTASSPALPLAVYYTSFACDPAPSTTKSFQVAGAAAAQTIGWTDSNGAHTTVVPALPAPPPAPTPTPTPTPGSPVPQVTFTLPATTLPVGTCYIGEATATDSAGNKQELFVIVCPSLQQVLPAPATPTN